LISFTLQQIYTAVEWPFFTKKMGSTASSEGFVEKTGFRLRRVGFFLKNHRLDRVG
jgi:hypothetical protein